MGEITNVLPDERGRIFCQFHARRPHFYLLSVSEYEIAATTGHSEDASTTENAWIVLEGRKARSKEFVLENKKKKFLRWVWLHGLNIVTRPLIISDAGPDRGMNQNILSYND